MRTNNKIPVAVTRVDNWPGALAAFVEARRHVPFEWGKNDCCLFACDGILTITGLDPAAKIFRGKYRGKLGAARLLKKHGGIEAGVEQIAASYGFVECAVTMARRGDLVCMAVDEEFRPIAISPKPIVAHYALGICIGSLAVFAGPMELQFAKMEYCRRAWRVG